ncbi:MAG: xanthine dehydrogenase family protein molybdopterin-binding subunit [Syntrophobacteraceae bacterium]
MAEEKSSGPKLVGENYTPPDLLPKITGRAKYAEDFRAEGMLYCKLLLSPMPHARVRKINTRAALAMPGVRAIITEEDLSGPADTVTDTGEKIKANNCAESALSMEPMFQGAPVCAVAAVDELTAAEAIEQIEIDFEPLPFVIDPLASLRPGGPNARSHGNAWVHLPGKAGVGVKPELREIKWREADFSEAGEGRLPPGSPGAEWSYGDIEAGFKDAALVLDETFATPNISHETLETRSALAWWENGKLFLHTGTQSTIQTIPAIARWMKMDPGKIVLVSEYTGGGFGSKAVGAISLVIPAVLSRKAKAPVMMRISREEEHFIGGARPALWGRMKAGFSREGRLLALDMFTLQDNGPFQEKGDGAMAGRVVSLLYQPQAMRWRGIAVLTNTPARDAQTGPGGVQGVTLMEPVLSKAARKLGIDQVAIRRLNAPEGKAKFGPPEEGGSRPYTTSAFVKEALDKGASLFAWEERKNRAGKRRGAKVRGTGVAVGCFVAGTTGFDGMIVIEPNGKVRFQCGIGNLGTQSLTDVHRVAAQSLGVAWDRCEIVWGDTAKHLAWSCVSGGSQTIHSMTRAALAAALDARKKLQQIASLTLGGRPEDYEVAGERVFRPGGGAAMSFAEAAGRAVELGGVYDGHEFPEDIDKRTKASVRALAGRGLLAVAKDNFPRDGQTFSYVATFAEVEVDTETGMYRITDFLVVGDCGVVVHPRACGGQLLGRSMLGIGHAVGQKWVYDPHYGLPLAKRFYHTKPMTILDAPDRMQWETLGIPDPETPVGARGIGEPPTVGACPAILNALADALGDDVFRRAPVTADNILAGKPDWEHLFTANI